MTAATLRAPPPTASGGRLTSGASSPPARLAVPLLATPATPAAPRRGMTAVHTRQPAGIRLGRTLGTGATRLRGVPLPEAGLRPGARRPAMAVATAGPLLRVKLLPLPSPPPLRTGVTSPRAPKPLFRPLTAATGTVGARALRRRRRRDLLALLLPLPLPPWPLRPRVPSPPPRALRASTAACLATSRWHVPTPRHATSARRLGTPRSSVRSARSRRRS